MIKVGEHITLDFLGVKKDYPPDFYEKIFYKISKKLKWNYLKFLVINLNHKVSHL